jgi:integrase/recombinase XerD
MARKNPGNEKIKLNYFEFLRHADGKSEQTIRQVERSLTRFEESTRRAPFKSFDQKQAIAFKEALLRQELSPATVFSTTQDVKRFLSWLALQQGFKRAIRLTDIEYLNLTDKMARTAMQPAEKSYPSLQMTEKVVASMPHGTPIEKRNRALIAFSAITGIRDGALVTLKVKHFDEERCLVLQNPNEVSTKFGKRIDTFLFPLNEEFESIVFDWVRYLKNEELFAGSDPLFPKTALGQGS